MSIHQEFLSKAISLRSSQSSYSARLTRYPNLAELAPNNIGDIVNETRPWFCHGLGIRLALWTGESGFLRFERAIDCAKVLDNFDRKWRNHWTSQALVDYERYFQLLWMLQCAEDFVDKGLTVSFAAGNRSGPDLIVNSPNNISFYVESCVYSKWWFLENFLKEIIAPFGEDLRIERRLNVPFPGFASIQEKVEFIDGFIRVVNDSTRLSDGRHAARISWPIELHRDRGMRLVIESDNIKTHVPYSNPHGDPSCSLKIFISEIIRAKVKSNNLLNCRPNVLMVNCLGVDIQMGYDYPVKPDLSELDFGPIDALLVCSCGIDSAPSKQPWLLYTTTQDHPIRTLYVGQPWINPLEG